MGNSQGKPIVSDNRVCLNHFRLLRVVGKGAFGKVRIVERKDSGLTFALKYIRKDEIVRQESVRNIVRERRMLEHLNHPFLCNLRYSFQDMEYLYLVVDLMSGGDLRFHISRKSFTEECVRFWMSEVACALRYIHAQGIVHRDVKPDNILLDCEGHVHLADFNVASDFRPTRQLTSKSGTLAYLAPESFKGTGYLHEVDWWSLGVTFYECMYGRRPFEGKSHDELADAVCAANPRFYVTKPPISMPCLHAMSSLMEKDKRKRIGAASWESFTDNPFFRPIDFVALEQKQILPVFVPSSDKTNFDATYDLEELLLEEAPLEARARKQKPRAELRQDATSKEKREDELHRMIETMFEPFDYTLAKYDITAAEAVAGAVPDEHPELKVQPRPTERSNTSTTSSSNRSNEDSPPISPEVTPIRSREDNNPAAAEPEQSVAHDKDPASGSPTAVSFSRPLAQQRPQPAKRQVSKTGGVTMILSEGGSWSNLADQSTSHTNDANSADKSNGSVLGFLSRKKGRDKAPKAKESGVLGKAGARQIMS